MGAIWAQDRGGIIGADGRMLWRVPEDFRHFRATTLGGVVIMGRTTWESIGSALAGRQSIVLTRRSAWHADGARAVGSLPDALGAAREALGSVGPDPRDGEHSVLPRLWVIGGGSVYERALDEDLVNELVVTALDLDVSGPAGRHAVHAPVVDDARWRRDPRLSDRAGQWRPVSGDARWRVDHWARVTA